MSFQEKKPGLISLTSAVLASVCCVLPLLALTFGIVGFGLAGTVGRYSPLFMSLGAAGLGLAYYLYFRERRRCDAIGCRMVGQVWNRLLLGLSTAMMIGLLALKFLPLSAQEPPSEVRGLEERLVLQVDGMT